MMKVKEMRLLTIRVMQNNEVLYEGAVENAPEEIKEYEIEDKLIFDSNTLVLYIK